MRKGSSKKTSPDSAFQLSVTTVEEQGILESFSKLPQTERGIIRQLLEKCDPQQVGVIRLPVPFGPKKFKERRRMNIRPVFKLPPPPLPTADVTEATVGSFFTISVTRFCFSTIAPKEISCAASVKPKTMPVSC